MKPKGIVRAARYPLSPIPCKGRWVHNTDGSDFECDYPRAGFGCEECVVNGGRFDPRTGKRTRAAI